MPDTHALLGPSSAHRWLACTPSARLEENMEDQGSDYAREGTLAHRLGELRLRFRFEKSTLDEYTEALSEVVSDPMYSGAMEEHIDAYVAFVEERMAEAKTRCADPRIFIEQTVKFDEYVPEAFGTADCIILADGLMDVIDFKYGKGVPVSAENNPQMKLYALGCYLALSWAYEIPLIRMTIFQPRLDSVSTAEISSEDLLAWAEQELKPRAALAWEGKGDFAPGEETCRWCKAAPICRARANYQLELAKYDFAQPATLTPEEVAVILLRLPDFTSWATQVTEFAQDAAVNKGITIPGFKLVEGRSNRKYVDEDAIAKALRKAGYKVADIYKPKALLGITAMEKLLGKHKMETLIAPYITKPPGAPTLVPETDPRAAINTADQAAADFADSGALAPAT